MFQMGQQQMSMLAPESGPPRILPEAIQYVCHFKENEEGKLHFLAMDPFSTHEFSVDVKQQNYSDFTTYTGNNEKQMMNIKYLKEPDAQLE
jgi:flagellar assembly factor FliW